MFHAMGCADAPTTADPALAAMPCWAWTVSGVEDVDRWGAVMKVRGSTPWHLTSCPDCGVVASGRGWRVRGLHDVSHGAVRVALQWYGAALILGARVARSQSSPEPSRCARFADGLGGDLGVAEHILHHRGLRMCEPKELTGTVDLTREQHGRTHSRLLDLV
ncbi:hypothetical protein ACFSYH_07830 [Populibacterium corticicola]|uniref:Transposase n=1 Tax=Populibacterium corticicola TaxID=1812826 RepID=A0ABW5XES7_9MICO